MSSSSSPATPVKGIIKKPDSTKDSNGSGSTKTVTFSSDAKKE